MDHENTRLDPPNSVDFAFDRVEDVMHGMQNFFTWISKTLNLSDCQTMTKRVFHEHPILAVFIGVATAMSAFPVFCFLVFAVTTSSFLFLGFLLVEGTILACAFVVLLGTIFVVMFLAIGCSVVIVTLYYAAVFVRQLSSGVMQRPGPVDSHID